MRPQGVDDLGALAYQHIARAMLHQLTLLFGRFDPHEAPGRSPNRFADRLGVSIVLVALDVGLHVLRWHQPQPVAKLREFTCPVMGRGAGLQAWARLYVRRTARKGLRRPRAFERSQTGL